MEEFAFKLHFCVKSHSYGVLQRVTCGVAVATDHATMPRTVFGSPEEQAIGRCSAIFFVLNVDKAYILHS